MPTLKQLLGNKPSLPDDEILALIVEGLEERNPTPDETRHCIIHEEGLQSRYLQRVRSRWTAPEQDGFVCKDNAFGDWFSSISVQFKITTRQQENSISKTRRKVEELLEQPIFDTYS